MCSVRSSFFHCTHRADECRFRRAARIESDEVRCRSTRIGHPSLWSELRESEYKGLIR
jgi:hypothetical protein